MLVTSDSWDLRTEHEDNNLVIGWNLLKGLTQAFDVRIKLRKRMITTNTKACSGISTVLGFYVYILGVCFSYSKTSASSLDSKSFFVRSVTMVTFCLIGSHAQRNSKIIQLCEKCIFENLIASNYFNRKHQGYLTPHQAAGVTQSHG